MDDSIKYITNPNKTAGKLLIGSFNCRPDAAYRQMMQTKAAFGKEGGRQGYHLIQSFAPGEVPPETAFAIAQQYVQEYLSERYEVIFSIHEDKNHIHAHIIWNAVSFTDGRKYHADKREYPDQIRAISDRLCRRHGISVIEPQGTGKHYAEYMAEQQGKSTIRGQIRRELDEIIGQSYNLTMLWDNLRNRGYAVRRGKYISIKPPFSDRSIRLQSLGPEYTEDGIRERIHQMRKGALETPAPGRATIPQLPEQAGYQETYTVYLQALTLAQTRQLRPQLSAIVREDIRAIERLQAQYFFLADRNLYSRQQLDQYESHLDSLMSAMADHRTDLHRARRRGESPAENPADITACLRTLRKEKRLIADIKAKAPTAYEQVRRIVEIQQKEQDRHKTKNIRRNAIV